MAIAVRVDLASAYRGRATVDHRLDVLEPPGKLAEGRHLGESRMPVPAHRPRDVPDGVALAGDAYHGHAEDGVRVGLPRDAENGLLPRLAPGVAGQVPGDAVD